MNNVSAVPIAGHGSEVWTLERKILDISSLLPWPCRRRCNRGTALVLPCAGGCGD